MIPSEGETSVGEYDDDEDEEGGRRRPHKAGDRTSDRNKRPRERKVRLSEICPRPVEQDGEY